MEITIKVEGIADIDYYPRAHGLAVDESLDTRFWESQPALVLSRATAKSFTKSVLKDLSPGRHTVTYGVSAHSSTPWITKITSGDLVLAEGANTYGNYLTASFVILPGGNVMPTPALPTLGGRIPFFADLRTRIMSILGR